LQFAETALTKSPPTAEERLVIHDLFMLQLSQRSKYERGIPKDGTYTYLSEAKQSSVTLCQPQVCSFNFLCILKSHKLILLVQEKNMHGKIFGGYVMRKGFELAYTTAYLHSLFKL
jgi:acyl-coenzyme A thioesterase 9